MPGPEDPDRPSGISPWRGLCIGFRCVQTVAVCMIAFTRLDQTSGCAVTLPAYRVPCGRFTWFVRGCRSSSPSATLGTAGWLDLTRWGLPPHKKRQASLGARARGHSTARAARRRGRGRQLKVHVGRLHGHVGEAHRAGGWEQMRHNGVQCLKLMAHSRLLYRDTPLLRSLSPNVRKTPRVSWTARIFSGNPSRDQTLFVSRCH
jgi:hypothetical protein